MAVDLAKYDPSPTRAGRFFASIDARSQLEFSSADSLYDWLAVGAKTALSGSPSAALANPNIVYRGQPNAQYGLTSSLYRHCRQKLRRIVRESDLVTTESAILEAMRSEGLGRLMADLELLQVLQHHGIPTRLVDVSAGPLEALFFAVDKEDAADGRLFIIRLDARRAGDRVFTAPGDDLPWRAMARGKLQAQNQWTQTLALVDADPLDPRMRAQRGKFLVGGLNRRSAGRNMYRVPKDEFADVASLGINFLKQLRTARNACWPATGWTIRIPAKWKGRLRKRLAYEEQSVRPDSMYPPITEVRRLALARASEVLVEA